MKTPFFHPRAILLSDRAHGLKVRRAALRLLIRKAIAYGYAERVKVAMQERDGQD